MKKKDKIKLFNDDKIRTKWDSEIEEYYVSVIDVIAILSGSKNPNDYWYRLKKRELENGVDLSTNCRHLKMLSEDGKFYKTDVATPKEMLRIIQSIPSPKAEPFKQWLAQLGQDRLDEIADPELAMQRAVETYRAKGYSEEWIEQRIESMKARKKLTAEWNRVGVEEGLEYAILTNDITKAWSGMTTKEYKQHKGLKKQGLRDNMTDMELIFNMLAEKTTTEISQADDPDGFLESRSIAQEGGELVGDYRRRLEKRTGKKYISKDNASDPKKLDKRDN